MMMQAHQLPHVDRPGPPATVATVPAAAMMMQAHRLPHVNRRRRRPWRCNQVPAAAMMQPHGNRGDGAPGPP